jgi:hypothetical protein
MRYFKAGDLVHPCGAINCTWEILTLEGNFITALYLPLKFDPVRIVRCYIPVELFEKVEKSVEKS